MIGKVEARFWKKTRKSGECIVWTGSTSNGYGDFKVDGKKVRAHRFSYQMKHGKVPSLDVLHRCDNPACVNPEHLYEGDDKQNALDRDSRGRRNTLLIKGERNGRAKLTDSQVEEIKTSTSKGKDLALKFNISQEYVSRLKRGHQR